MSSTLPAVLFVCTGNSCRSQMAEGYAHAMHGQVLNACSAGTLAHGLNPLAVQVMAEDGIDISRHTSKTLAQLDLSHFALVVTVCDNAQQSCPILPDATRVIHQPFDDPPQLAAGLADAKASGDCYRRVRDEIRAWMKGLPALLAA